MLRMRARLARLGRLVPACLLALGLGGPGIARAAGSAQHTLATTLAGLSARSGGSNGVLVRDLTIGRTLYSLAPNTPRLPASVEKIYTTSTALLRMGAHARLQTQLYGVGRLDSHGIFHGTLYLRGGGDPTFGSASFDRYAYGTGATIEQLVANLRTAGIKAVRGTVVGDETYFDADRGTSATGDALSSYIEGELSGLAYDRGFTDQTEAAFQADPALFAAQQLVYALRADGVAVPRGTTLAIGRTPRGAVALASVSSPSLASLIELTNSPSDNFLAEMLLKGLGARYGAGGTTSAGAAVVRAQVAGNFGLHPAIVDGSGLSRADRTSPRDVVTALTDLAGNSYFTGSLAIGGVRGTMQAGLAGTAASGRCRGKTGSLHDVADLVGYCTAQDHHELVFAFMMNGLSDPDYGHSLEDEMAVAVARYSG